MHSIDFEQLRQINPFDYLTQHEGFTVHPKTNKSWVSSNKPTGNAVLQNPLTGDIFLVSRDARNTLEYRIKTTDGTRINTGRGASSVVDLVSFCAWLHNADIRSVAVTINSKSALSAVSENRPIYAVAKRSNSTIDIHRQIVSNIKPLTNYSYLKARGISDAIIQDPLFTNRISNYKAGNYNNLSFNCYDQNDRLITCCQRYFDANNKAVKLFPFVKDESGINVSPSTSGTLWRSNVPKEPQFLVFGESPEDVLSYYQLNPILKDKALLCSSLGNFREDQAVLLTHLCDLHKIRKIILVNDNDAAGLRFDLTALRAVHSFGSVGSPFLSSSCNLINNEAHHHVNKLHLNFSFNYGQFFFANDFFSNIESSLINNNQRLAFSDGLILMDDGASKKYWSFDLFLKNDSLHIDDFLFCLFKADDGLFFGNHFLLDKSPDFVNPQNIKVATKDWNEFLLLNSQTDSVSANKSFSFFNKPLEKFCTIQYDNQQDNDFKKKVVSKIHA